MKNKKSELFVDPNMETWKDVAKDFAGQLDKLTVVNTLLLEAAEDVVWGAENLTLGSRSFNERMDRLKAAVAASKKK